MQRDRSTIQKARGELGRGGEVHSRLQRRALTACTQNQVPNTPEWEEWITGSREEGSAFLRAADRALYKAHKAAITTMHSEQIRDFLKQCRE
eukprot:2565136-Rhodomonas_salina.1